MKKQKKQNNNNNIHIIYDRQLQERGRECGYNNESNQKGLIEIEYSIIV